MEKNLHSAEMQSYIKNIKRWILPIKIYITLEYTRKWKGLPIFRPQNKQTNNSKKFRPILNLFYSTLKKEKVLGERKDKIR